MPQQHRHLQGIVTLKRHPCSPHLKQLFVASEIGLAVRDLCQRITIEVDALLSPDTSCDVLRSALCHHIVGVISVPGRPFEIELMTAAVHVVMFHRDMMTAITEVECVESRME